MSEEQKDFAKFAPKEDDFKRGKMLYRQGIYEIHNGYLTLSKTDPTLNNHHREVFRSLEEKCEYYAQLSEAMEYVLVKELPPYFGNTFPGMAVYTSAGFPKYVYLHENDKEIGLLTDSLHNGWVIEKYRYEEKICGF